MSNLKRKPQQVPDVSVYDPECAVYSPELIEEWTKTVELVPKDYEKFVVDFLTLIPFYCCGEDNRLSGSPEFWQRDVLSYSFFFGLGITIFDRSFAQKLLYGLTEGWSKVSLFWLNEIKKTDTEDNVQLWTHSINVLTVHTGFNSPETTGSDADEKLVKQRSCIAGFTPAIRLGLYDPEFTRTLFEGAVDEREKCDDENLVGRINWIKTFIIESLKKNQARSSN